MFTFSYTCAFHKTNRSKKKLIKKFDEKKNAVRFLFIVYYMRWDKSFINEEKRMSRGELIYLDILKWHIYIVVWFLLSTDSIEFFLLENIRIRHTYEAQFDCIVWQIARSLFFHTYIHIYTYIFKLFIVVGIP